MISNEPGRKIVLKIKYTFSVQGSNEEVIFNY